MSVSRNYGRYGYGGFVKSYGGHDATAKAVKALSDGGIEHKASYTTGTNSGALVNDLFGAALYVQTNLEANFFGAIPKVDRTDANVRAEQPLPLTYRAAHSPPSLQTHAEGGSVPSGRTYTPEEVSADIKRSDAVIVQSALEEIRAQLLDGVPFEELQRVDQLFQELAIDRDALASAVSAGNGGYASRDKVTELDRVIASSTEEANGVDESNTAYSDSDLDIYNIDRSADTWADSFVDQNGGTLRQLTEDLMDGFLSGLFDFGAITREDAVILTGSDTADVLSDLQQDSTDGVAVVNFDGSDGGRDQVENAETVHGLAGTTRFRHYKGVPIVKNQNAPSDSLSRIYVIPTDEMTLPGGETAPRLAIEEYAAPYVEVAGRNEEQGFLSIGSYENKALFKMDHELICRDFSSTGKLRDIEQ